MVQKKHCAEIAPEPILVFDGRPIPMVPFVQKILKNVVLGVVEALNGCEGEGEIVIRFQKEE